MFLNVVLTKDGKILADISQLGHNLSEDFDREANIVEGIVSIPIDFPHQDLDNAFRAIVNSNGVETPDLQATEIKRVMEELVSLALTEVGINYRLRLIVLEHRDII